MRVGVILAVVGALGAAVGVYYAGDRAGAARVTAAWEKSKVAQADADSRARASAAVVSARVGQATGDAIGRTQIVKQVIHDQVEVYVPAAADAACVVPVGAVELLNAATEDRPPNPTVDPPETASGVALHSVVDIEAANLGDCNIARQQVIGWQAWFAETRAALGLPPLIDSATVSAPAG